MINNWDFQQKHLGDPFKVTVTLNWAVTPLSHLSDKDLASSAEKEILESEKCECTVRKWCELLCTVSCVLQHITTTIQHTLSTYFVILEYLRFNN